MKLASAEFAECRIERIFVQSRLKETIRFSDWRGGRFNKRALDLSEDELLVLIGDVIAARVFRPSFLDALGEIIAAQTTRETAVSAQAIRRKPGVRPTNADFLSGRPYETVGNAIQDQYGIDDGQVPWIKGDGIIVGPDDIGPLKKTMDEMRD